VEQQNPERFRELIARGQADIARHFAEFDEWTRRTSS